MNSLIIFPVIFSIIIGDIYGKSFDFEQLRKLSMIKKRTAEDVVENQLDSTPCPVIECLILTDSAFSPRFDYEEEIIDYINDIISATQDRFDGLELNITVRLIGRISYTKETEPDFIKAGLDSEKPNIIYANEVIFNMRYMEKTPLVEKADIIVVITG
ncbi:venom metalloproteinase antarease-like TpachMP_A [Centruroides vittatus]|uniref:venom metalloproteinase antarease-like TpachMP_A n=1 Tax=Centruroides vittatus TaxID=120091 RepID=UPI00350F9A62